MSFRTSFAVVLFALACSSTRAQDWHTTGNVIAPSDWLGTQNQFPLEMRVNNVTAFRLINTLAGTPNIVGGSSNNSVLNGASGCIIGGGGSSLFHVTYDNFCVIGGGEQNLAGSADGNPGTAPYATVSGGLVNQARALSSTVGGGANNLADGPNSTVAGGVQNRAWGPGAAIGGGSGNNAYSPLSTVIGGSGNFIGFSTLGTSGVYSTVLGGQGNHVNGDLSLAAGLRAVVNGRGTFVWADSTTPTTGFVSSGNNQFLVRATGGFGLNTASPAATMHINGLSNSSIGLFVENAYSAIEGTSTASNGNGVVGICNSGSSAWGISGASTQGQGVVGRAGPGPLPGGGFPPETGTVGFTTAVTGIGVFGEAASPTGVNYGVYGVANSPTGWAGYFDGNVHATGTVTWTSCRELKQDIKPLSGALETIMRLQGVSYVWNESASASVRGKGDIGFIADEMEQVLPDIVAKDETGKPIGIDYAKVTPVAVEAIKALKTENDELKARLAKVEAILAAQADVAK